jgi:hypothetical protein
MAKVGAVLIIGDDHNAHTAATDLATAGGKVPGLELPPLEGTLSPASQRIASR